MVDGFPDENGGLIEEAVELTEEGADREVQALVTRMVEEAIQYYEESLQDDQERATDYYHGRPFGNEEEGRSKVVATVIRDATQAQLPSLMRIFFGSEHVVEYRPRRLEQEAMARQMTDYIRDVVIQEDNEGFLILYSAFKDALVRRIGVVKWYWEPNVRITADQFQSLSEDQVAILASEPGVDVEILAENPSPWGPLFDVEVRRSENEGKVRVVAVPPEEFVFTPGARDLDDAACVAHVRDVPADEVLALGVDPEVVERFKGSGGRTRLSDTMAAARDISGTDPRFGRFVERDDAQALIQLAEVYAKVDVDGDGFAERRKFICVGPAFEIANGDGEPVDEVPFAVFTPDPEPHTIIGLSNYDNLKDVQLIQSQILRDTLDNLAEVVDPPIEVLQGAVNMQDVMNKERSKFIRSRQLGAIREVERTFVAPHALTMLSYFDEIKEKRTGMTKAALGLDANSLQSATKMAVAATMSASQQRIELLARIFAEIGLKRLFKGLLRTVIRYQDRARVVRLRGEYVEVDPRSWDATLDVFVNVGLGTGSSEEKFAVLAAAAEKQEMLLERGVPLVSFVEYRNTLGRMLEMAGYRNTDEFFRPWGPQEQAMWDQAQAQAAANQPPDPNQLIAQAELMKAQAQVMSEQVSAQLEQMKLQLREAQLELEAVRLKLSDDRARDKLARDTALKAAELAVDVETNRLSSQIEQDRKQQDADL